MDTVSIVKKLAWIDRIAGYVWVFLTLLMILAILNPESCRSPVLSPGG